MSSSGNTGRRNKMAELELRRLIRSGQPPMTPDGPSSTSSTLPMNDDPDAMMELQDAIDEELIREFGSQGTERREKGPPPSGEDTTPGSDGSP